MANKDDGKSISDEMAALFSGPHAEYYGTELRQRIGGMHVEAESYEAAYERALGRQSPYIGKSAHVYILDEMRTQGFTPVIVAEQKKE